jgi:hypothetical protein
MISNLSPFTKLHVLISLIGIVSGLVVMVGLLVGEGSTGGPRWFLISTVLTSVTGFFFPFHGITPAIVVGIISLVLFGDRDRGPIRSSSRASLALDLRGDGDDLALLQCLRPGRATLPEGAGSESFGANAIRAAIRCDANCRAGAFYLAHDYRGNQVSR